MLLATSNGHIGASKVKVLLGVGNGFVDSEPSSSSCDLVDLHSSCDCLAGGVVNANCGGLYDGYLVLLLLEFLGKSLQHKLLVLQLVFALVVDLGLAPVHLDLHSDLLD